MDSYITLSLVDYIHLLHRGMMDKTLFAYFEKELKNCSAYEVNTAIENLMIRYGNVEEIETTVARFIRAAALGLDGQSKTEYSPDTVFHILDGENRVIEGFLSRLKMFYMENLEDLRSNRLETKGQFLRELEKIETVRKHYHKLQYGVFPALESEEAPTRCIQLMWHLEDSVWPKLKECLQLLTSEEWDFNRFNKAYGQMFFLLGSLAFREDKILFPAASRFLSQSVQNRLIRDAETHGIITGI